LEDPQNPNATLSRRRVTLEEFERAFNFLVKKIEDLSVILDNSSTRLWTNQVELKNGLGSSEFNLRTHQKVINALILDLAPMNILNGLQITKHSINDVTSSVVDWSYYHTEVEKDLNILKEQEIKSKQVEPILTKEVGSEIESELIRNSEYPAVATIFGG
jgi:hypothetical protein